MPLSDFKESFPLLCSRLEQAKRNGRTGQAYLFLGDDPVFLEKFALACQSLPSEHFDNVLERRVFNLSVTSECLAPFYVTAHLPNKVRVLYLEVCIAYKSPSCQTV